MDFSLGRREAENPSLKPIPVRGRRENTQRRELNPKVSLSI